jgi:hypothetical protein
MVQKRGRIIDDQLKFYIICSFVNCLSNQTENSKVKDLLPSEWVARWMNEQQKSKKVISALKETSREVLWKYNGKAISQPGSCKGLPKGDDIHSEP